MSSEGVAGVGLKCTKLGDEDGPELFVLSSVASGVGSAGSRGTDGAVPVFELSLLSSCPNISTPLYTFIIYNIQHKT